jgi:hypothetical protein
MEENEEESKKILAYEDYQYLIQERDELKKELDKATSKLDEIKGYIDSELIKISNHQYAIGTRRLNNILSIIDKD